MANPLLLRLAREASEENIGHFPGRGRRLLDVCREKPMNVYRYEY